MADKRSTRADVPDLRQYPVLLVDDEPSNLLVLSTVLEDDFNILMASSGEEALSIVESEHVAVVLTDQRMPGMTGVDLCAVLQERHPGVRRILITAYTDLRSAVDAINRGGIEHYIQKPWSRAHVVQVLREAIARVHLERLVHSLRDELVEHQRSATMAEARAMALHDLVNVHHPIIIASQSLDTLLQTRGQDIPADVRADLKEDVDLLSEAARCLTELHQRTRETTLHPNQPPEWVSAREVLRLVVRLLRGHDGPNVQIRTSADTDAWLFVRRTDIARVLVNLARNAVQAIESAGVTAGIVDLRVSDDADRTRITVVDNGPGIPAELRGRVFEAWSTTHRTRGGSGLGLYIAQDLTAANGGRLSFDCPDSGGTVFTLDLPSRGSPPQGVRG